MRSKVILSCRSLALKITHVGMDHPDTWYHVLRGGMEYRPGLIVLQNELKRRRWRSLSLACQRSASCIARVVASDVAKQCLHCRSIEPPQRYSRAIHVPRLRLCESSCDFDMSVAYLFRSRAGMRTYDRSMNRVGFIVWPIRG